MKYTNHPILDIAEMNPTGQYLAQKLGVTIDNTNTDLDYEIGPLPSAPYKAVWCFEVIEHLMNPRAFMDNLHKVTHHDAQVFLSYPSRPKWLWNNEQHFHEYDELRFSMLLKKTGWEVVDQSPIYVSRPINGIRPIIRNMIPQTRIFELRKIYA